MVGEHEYFIKKGAVAKVEVAKGGGVSAGQASSSDREMEKGGTGSVRTVAAAPLRYEAHFLQLGKRHSALLAVNL